MKPIEIIEAKRQHIARLATQRGAIGEASALSEMASWVPRPQGRGLKVLLAALLETGINVRGSSFDAISHPDAGDIDFTDPVAVLAALPDMIFIEIKTATQQRVRPDFSNFFFALTESEIAAADALGSRHQVALYNRLTNEILITSIPQILARAKSTNWQVSVQL